jgi:hypothetical protein
VPPRLGASGNLRHVPPWPITEYRKNDSAQVHAAMTDVPRERKGFSADENGPAFAQENGPGVIDRVAITIVG